MLNISLTLLECQYNSSLKNVNIFLQMNFRQFYTSIILSTTAISMYLLMLIGGFIDVLIEAPNIEPVIRFSLVFAGLSIVRILLDYLRAILYVKIQIKSGYSLMTDVAKHAQNLSFINKNDSAMITKNNALGNFTEGAFYKRLRRQDLNLRPTGYEPVELPNCSTPRLGIL